MILPTLCGNCGTRIEVPANFNRPRIRCAECGVLSDVVTPDLPKSDPDSVSPTTSREKPPPSRPKREPKAPPPPAVLLAGTEADDGQAYGVLGDPHTPMGEPCPECGKPRAVDATVCLECGFNSATGERSERIYTPINGSWEAGWSFSTRLTLFAAIQGLNLFSAISAMSVGVTWSTALLGALVMAAGHAFLLGTYERVRFTRDRKGRCKLYRSVCIAFFSTGEQSVRLRDYGHVLVTGYGDADLYDWLMFLFLLPYLVVPAAIWWWNVIRPGKYTAALGMTPGAIDLRLYRGSDFDKARDIGKTISDATGMILHNA